MEYYDDAKLSPTPIPTPNEAEFRSYYILLHLRNPDIGRKLDSLSPELYHHPMVQAAVRFRSLAQRSNNPPTRRALNVEGSQNMFSQFFRLIAHESTSYLTACVLVRYFTEMRNGALKAMRRSYNPNHQPFPISDLTRLLLTENDDYTMKVIEGSGLPTKTEKGLTGVVFAKNGPDYTG